MHVFFISQLHSFFIFWVNNWQFFWRQIQIYCTGQFVTVKVPACVPNYCFDRHREDRNNCGSDMHCRGAFSSQDLYPGALSHSGVKPHSMHSRTNISWDLQRHRVCSSLCYWNRVNLTRDHAKKFWIFYTTCHPSFFHNGIKKYFNSVCCVWCTE